MNRFLYSLRHLSSPWHSVPCTACVWKPFDLNLNRRIWQINIEKMLIGPHASYQSHVYLNWNSWDYFNSVSHLISLLNRTNNCFCNIYWPRTMSHMNHNIISSYTQWRYLLESEIIFEAINNSVNNYIFVNKLVSRKAQLSSELITKSFNPLSLFTA